MRRRIKSLLAVVSCLALLLGIPGAGIGSVWAAEGQEDSQQAIAWTKQAAAGRNSTGETGQAGEAESPTDQAIAGGASASQASQAAAGGDSANQSNQAAAGGASASQTSQAAASEDSASQTSQAAAGGASANQSNQAAASGDSASQTSQAEEAEDATAETDAEGGEESPQNLIAPVAVAETGLSVQLSEDEKQITLQALLTEAQAAQLANGAVLKYAVWSDTNGQDDLGWYQATYENGSYVAQIAVSNFKNPGGFTAHAYLFGLGGGASYVDGVRFTVNGPSLQSLTLEEGDAQTGQFRIRIQGLTDKSGLEQVRVAVWSGNQSNLYWYDGVLQGSDYLVTGSLANHGFQSGTYLAHVYVKDGNGFYTFAGGGSGNLTAVSNKIYIYTENQREYKLAIGSLEGSNQASQVRFAVWSQQGGQDDLRWYQAVKKNGTWSYTVKVSDHKTYGAYAVHCYGVNSSGKLYYITAASFTVDKPSAGKITMDFPDSSQGNFNVQIPNLSAPAGLTKVEVAVWSAANQSNLVWYTAADLGNGTWQASGSLAKHKNQSGTYSCHVYVTDGNGIKSYVGGVNYKVEPSSGSLTAEVQNLGNQLVLRMTGMKTYGIFQSLRFAVWSAANGQKDLRWFQASQEGGSGSAYSALIDMSQYQVGGKYTVHAYMTDLSGAACFAAGTSFQIDGEIQISQVKAGKFTIRGDKFSPDRSMVSLQAEVWTGSGQSSQTGTSQGSQSGSTQSNPISYTADKNSDGSYTVTVSLADFDSYIGTYSIRLYAISSSGSRELVAETQKEVAISTGSFGAVVASESGLRYTVTLQQADLLGLQKEVRFGVWSQAGGQDDLVWYKASEKDGSYTVTIPMGNHSGTGLYSVHVYYVLASGEMRYLNATSFQADSVPAGTLRFENVNGQTGSFDVIGELGQLGITVSKVKVAVWVDNVICWYQMQLQSDGTYKATADIKNFDSTFGTYTAHMYGEDAQGTNKFSAGGRVTLQADNYVVTSKPSSNQYQITIYGPNIKGVTPDSAKFATWSTLNGQDDLVWYQGSRNSDGSYTVTIDCSKHKHSGGYITHIYLYQGSTAAMVRALDYTLYRGGEFDDYAKEVMHKIIFAVETGGQVYGNAGYGNFTQAYTNSQKEYAITIGAGGWFATEAKKLLNLIRTEDPILFSELDTAGIAEDLDNENWSSYGGDGNGHATILKGSAKAVCIQNIISSDTGIAIQNRLVDEQMEQYVKEALQLGVTDLKAQMFCANVRHLGGYSPMKWMISCCQEDGLELTMENLWTSLRSHTTDLNGNGVGANKYKSRHEKVMGWLNQYID